MSSDHNQHHHEKSNDQHGHHANHEHHVKSRFDFSSLWRSMIQKGIWVIYPIMGVCLLHIFWLMNDRIDNIMYNSVPINEKPAPFQDIKSGVTGSVQKGMDLKLIKDPSPEMLAAAKSAFQERCVSCHGAEGKGDGPSAGPLLKPRNFHSKEGWKNGPELSAMFNSITLGIAPTGMPPFDYLSVELRISLIHYIRNFTKDYPAIKDSEVEGLDKQFNLSKETVTPHRIPINVATQLLVEESDETSKKSLEMVKKLTFDISKKNKNAMLLKTYSDNLEKTITSLQVNSVWKNDLESFVKFITVNIGVNGIKADLLLSDKSALEDLYSYLKGFK